MIKSVWVELPETVVHICYDVCYLGFRGYAVGKSDYYVRKGLRQFGEDII